MQPPFIFPTEENEGENIDILPFPQIFNSTTNTSALDSDLKLDTVTTERQSSSYLLGVGLVLYAAAAASVANVVQVFLLRQNTGITKNHLIIIGGELFIVHIVHKTQFPQVCGV